MFVIRRGNGSLVAAIEAQDCKVDMTGPNPVFIFIRGDMQSELCEDEHHRHSPYWNTEHIRKGHEPHVHHEPLPEPKPKVPDHKPESKPQPPKVEPPKPKKDK